MCCASGLPMQIALNQLLSKTKPDRLLIEPTGLLATSLVVLQDYLLAQYGLHIEINLLTEHSVYLIGAMLVASVIVAIIPSFSGYCRARSIA